ncbi:MAG: NACHT domain-containing protein, partial [Candidatus Jordarchaeaceae archaeon]
MPIFFHGLSSNWFSYLLGFFSGIIFIWFINVAKEVYYKAGELIREKRRKSQEDYLLTAESTYRNITYHYAQSLHLFSHLFPLDKICIVPTMLIPPSQVQPGESPFFTDLVSTTIPYLPDWPEMAMRFGAKTVTLAQVIEQENILRVAIHGNAGSGKTTALAHFASILCKGEPCNKKLEEYLPILVHIGEINLDSVADPVENLITAALSRMSSSLETRGIKILLNAKIRQGKAILLLDGLDELPVQDIDKSVKYLQSLSIHLPTLKVITTASLEYFDGLRELGFLFLPIACWNRTQRSHYIKRWVEIWEEISDNHETNPTNQLTNICLLLEPWINHNNPYADPLTLTLVLWSTLNNSLLGAKKIDAIESYTRCLCAPKVRPLVEKLAKQQLLSQCPIFTIEDLNRISPTLLESLSELIKSGLVKQYHTQKICFIHPIFASHLA